MTACRQGEVVLVRLVFSDESGAKLRPCLVVSSPGYNQGRQEVIVAAITSNVERGLFGDHVLGDWNEAGLVWPSTVTGILRTIKMSMIDRKLGSLSSRDAAASKAELRRCLSL